MADYKEVSPYTGQEIDEDAPANSVAGGGVSMPPDAVHDKKKKLRTREGKVIDGRTKSYREHRKKLEAARLRRLESKKKSTYVERVVSKMEEFTTDEKI